MDQWEAGTVSVRVNKKETPEVITGDSVDENAVGNSITGHQMLVQAYGVTLDFQTGIKGIVHLEAHL